MKFIIKQVSMSYEAFIYVTEFIFNHKQVATTELVQELVYDFNQLYKCGVYMKDLPKTEICEMTTCETVIPYGDILCESCHREYNDVCLDDETWDITCGYDYVGEGV